MFGWYVVGVQIPFSQFRYDWMSRELGVLLSRSYRTHNCSDFFLAFLGNTPGLDERTISLQYPIGLNVWYIYIYLPTLRCIIQICQLLWVNIPYSECLGTRVSMELTSVVFFC